MRNCRLALLLLLMLFVTARAATAQIKVVEAYVYGAGAKRVATFPTGPQLVGTGFSVQGLPANSNWKLSYYTPSGSLYTTASGAYNNPAPTPGVTTTLGIAVTRALVLTKGDWHIQLAVNGQQAKDIYFSAGLNPPVLYNSYTFGGDDYLTPKTTFDAGVNLIGITTDFYNFPAGSWWRTRYQRPDGTIAFDGSYDANNAISYPTAVWYTHYYVNLDQPGTWHIISDLNGQTLATKDFQVVPATSVLLVHGTWSSAATWSGTGGMIDTLQNQGYIVEAVNFPTEKETTSNETYIELQAQAIARRIQELQGRSGKQLTNLICHSMGGLAARYYLEHSSLWRLKDANGTPSSGVAKLIMLGTPNWGTDGAFLDPIASIPFAHWKTLPRTSNGYDSSASDIYSSWSPAIREMFAEWQPAPAKTGNTYIYPANFSPNLAKWPVGKETPLASPSYQSPIQTASYGVAYALLSVFTIYGSDYTATSGVLNAFPVDPRARRKNHLAYYPQMAQQLGIPYPQISGGTDGVDKRFVSQFLYDLNIKDIGNFQKSGARVYMAAGTTPIAYDPPHTIDGSVWDQTIVGPFNSDPFNGGIANDGVVPTDSELGRDPITGAYLYPQATRAIFGTFHIDLTSNVDVVNQVVSWLKE